MNIKDHKELIEKHYKMYKKIGQVECLAFGGEKIYFNKYGFRHIIRKGMRFRNIKEQIDRLNLIKYAPEIIRYSKSYENYNKNKIQNEQSLDANFWSFSQEFGRKEIIVIVRQMNGGHKHFFGVMGKSTKPQ